MGTAHGLVPLTPGLRFYKLMGSGKGGFGVWPDFGLYCFIGSWDAEAEAEDFLQNSRFMAAYRQRAVGVQTVFLKNTQVHGTWDGVSPFEPVASFDPDMPVAVITRATIKWRHMPVFWRHVPRVSDDVKSREARLFAVGIGELPFIQQATFSVWARGSDMLDYAYRRPEHRAMVRKTRELGWYKEEMFARFQPYRTEGSGFFPQIRNGVIAPG